MRDGHRAAAPWQVVGCMAMERRTDAALLRAAREADPEAFGAFYARHVDAVLAYFGRRVADREVVADLTAECFSAALLSVARWDAARGEPAAWLFGIAAHQLSRYRRRGAVERRARERLGIERIALSDAELREVLDGTDELLAALPEGQRTAVAARVLDDRAYDDIATELGVSEPVVRKRVSRGLTTLRGRLRPTEEDA